MRGVSRGMEKIQSPVTLLGSHKLRFCASNMPAIPGTVCIHVCVQEKERIMKRGRGGGGGKIWTQACENRSLCIARAAPCMCVALLSLYFSLFLSLSNCELVPLCVFSVRFGHWVCGENWHAVQPTPSSQGWGSGVLTLYLCLGGASMISGVSHANHQKSCDELCSV